MKENMAVFKFRFRKAIAPPRNLLVRRVGYNEGVEDDVMIDKGCFEFLDSLLKHDFGF